MLENLLNLVNLFDDCEVEKVDLSNDEDYKKLINDINGLKNNKTSKFVNSLLGLNNDFYDNLINIVEECHNKEKQNKESNVKPESKVIDKSEVTEPCCKCDNPCSICEKEYCDDCEYFMDDDEETTIERPSQRVSTEMGLQVHKLVQEYVDTMIKPYNPKIGGLSTKQINDAYVGLYEFACWILNK